MAYDPGSPARAHGGYSDLDQARENLNQLRKLEAASSAPANALAGMFWLDTSSSPYVVKQRNDANNAWITLWATNLAPDAHRLAATIDHPNGSVTNAKLASGIDGAKLQAGSVPDSALTAGPWVLAAGDLLWASADTLSAQVEGSTPVRVKEIKVYIAGEFRLKFDLRSTGGGSTARGQIYRNSSPVGTLQERASTNFLTYTEDISGWQPGQNIQLYISEAGGSGAAEIRNFRIYIERAQYALVTQD